MRDGPLRILVVDDEPAMIGVIGALVGSAGHRIIPAYDGEEAIHRFRLDAPDVVLLDLALPGLDGAAVCRAIRAESDAPIIVVSGETDAGVSVELLDAGADDFVRKPFRGDELLARIRAVLRRERREREPGDWAVDRARHRLSWRGTEIPVTVIELRLAARLVDAGDVLVEVTELLAAAWPGVPDPDPTWLKPHLARLRTKLRAAGAPVPVAVRGVGYHLVASVEDAGDA